MDLSSTAPATGFPLAPAAVQEDESPGIRDIPTFARLILKKNARYFVEDRGNTNRGVRDSVDAGQHPLLNVALNGSLQGDLLDFLEKIALDDHMHS